MIAYLIDSGSNTLAKLQKEIAIPRRTAQDTINALTELDIECVYIGATKNGHYQIKSWGTLDKHWIAENIGKVKETLEGVTDSV